MTKISNIILFLIILVFQIEVGVSQGHAAVTNSRVNRPAETTPTMVDSINQSARAVTSREYICKDPGSYAVSLAASGQKTSDKGTKTDHITPANPPLEQDRSASGSVPSERMDPYQAVDRLVETLVKQGKLKGQPVLITPHDLYDAHTGLSLPLALQLRGRLITQMIMRGVRVLLSGADEDGSMILQGTWHRQEKDLIIDMKVMKMGASGLEAVASASEKVSLKWIDPGDLTADRESWARYLVRRLERNVLGLKSCRVHVRDFKVGLSRCSPEFSTYLSGWLRPALAESRMFIPLDQQENLEGIPLDTLRKRGTKATPQELSSVKESTSLTADLLKADGELRGEVWLHREKVEVRTVVIDRKGQQITAAAVDVPLALFPPELLKPESNHSEVTDPSSGIKLAPDGISRNGLKIELTTTRGEDAPFYREGQHIRFVIRLNRWAWIYLFDLDPNGMATLLYPVDENGTLIRGGKCGSQCEPNQPLILPEDGCSIFIKVTAPYGRDTVWAVASESPLRFPTNLEGEWPSVEQMINCLRAQGLSRKDGYAETQVEIMTGP